MHGFNIFGDVLTITPDMKLLELFFRATAHDTAIVEARPNFLECLGIGFSIRAAVLFQKQNRAPRTLRSTLRARNELPVVVVVVETHHPLATTLSAGAPSIPTGIEFLNRHGHSITRVRDVLRADLSGRARAEM